jgi:CheY-like chemotaxis protein/anti-sigma regulatory factor (Ser/Thr protein kinase)
VRLLVVDDDPDYRLLVSLAVDGRPDLELVGEVATAEAGVEAAGRLRPDLVLLDLLLPDGGGAVAELREVAPDTAVVGTSAFTDGEVGPVASGGGRVVGHLSKSVRPSRLADEILFLMGMVGVVRRTVAATARLAPDAPSARQARRFVDDTLRGWECDDLRDTVELLVSELVTNAVIHARSEVDVSVLLLPDRVRIEVADQSPDGIERRSSDPQGSSGRGISMVETLALAWGVTPRRSGKTVWFEVARPPAARSGAPPGGGG